MKKILLIANYKQSVGGISGQVEILLNNFNNENIQFDLFNTRTSKLGRLLLPLKLLKKGQKYCVFHIMGCSFLGFYPIIIGTILGKFLKKKIIITYHGGGLQTFFNKYQWLIKYFLLKADQITVPSEYLQIILKNYSIKSHLLPNIIKEDNVTFKKRNRIEPNIITTRSLEKVYNISFLINSFAKIKVRFPFATLRIVGDGSLKKRLKNEVQELNLKDVEFVDHVKNTQIWKELNKSDIYINPTTVDNMPLSIFEAFASGLPVISTNVGGLSNFINDGENGLLIESNNIAQLVVKIEYLIENQENTQRIIINGYETFKKYTLERLKESYYDIYK